MQKPLSHWLSAVQGLPGVSVPRAASEGEPESCGETGTSALASVPPLSPPLPPLALLPALPPPAAPSALEIGWELLAHESAPTIPHATTSAVQALAGHRDEPGKSRIS